MVISSHGQLVTQSTHHSQIVTRLTRHTVNSSHFQLVTQSTCHSQIVTRSTRHTVNSSQSTCHTVISSHGQNVTKIWLWRVDCVTRRPAPAETLGLLQTGAPPCERVSHCCVVRLSEITSELTRTPRWPIQTLQSTRIGPAMVERFLPPRTPYDEDSSVYGVAVSVSVEVVLTNFVDGVLIFPDMIVWNLCTSSKLPVIANEVLQTVNFLNSTCKVPTLQSLSNSLIFPGISHRGINICRVAQ